MKGPTIMNRLSQDWINSLMDSIKDGDLDDSLKDIARACFLRGQAIGVIPQQQSGQPPRKRAASPKNRLTQDPKPPQRQPKSDPNWTGTKWWPVAPATNPLPGLRYVEFNGKSYLRQNFIGEEFVIQPGTYKDARFDGMTATITGAGKQAFKVRFDGSGGPTGPGNNNHGEVAFIDYKRAAYLFG